VNVPTRPSRTPFEVPRCKQSVSRVVLRGVGLRAIELCMRRVAPGEFGVEDSSEAAAGQRLGGSLHHLPIGKGLSRRGHCGNSAVRLVGHRYCASRSRRGVDSGCPKRARNAYDGPPGTWSGRSGRDGEHSCPIRLLPEASPKGSEGWEPSFICCLRTRCPTQPLRVRNPGKGQVLRKGIQFLQGAIE
jgi:hypothetical protein